MIALIGYMGSGKTTLAKQLGQSLNLPVYETDKIVFELAGTNSMEEVFADGGEDNLRKLELQAVSSLHNKPDGIIDCGGGLITHEPSLNELKKIAKQVIFLRVPFELALERVGNDSNRPLFSDSGSAEKIYQQRQSLYESVATNVIEVTGQPVEELVAQVEELI